MLSVNICGEGTLYVNNNCIHCVAFKIVNFSSGILQCDFIRTSFKNFTQEDFTGLARCAYKGRIYYKIQDTRWRDVIIQHPGHSHGYKPITADA